MLESSTCYIVGFMVRIKTVEPSMALPGGMVRVAVEQLGDPAKALVEVGGVRADIVVASSHHLTVKVPDGCDSGLSLCSDEGQDQCNLNVGQVVASELHSVANPVVDSAGNVYVTVSGARGQKVPFSIYVISPEGTKDTFLADVVNPTGLATGPDNCLYITSRHTGTVYRTTFDKQIEEYVDGLGLATGLVFDSKQNLVVGDRSGKIYRISPNREISILCNLEPSISAYHLAVSGDDTLFVTGPTLATQDCIHRISPEGQDEVLFKGFGRPQGIGFDSHDNLQVVASWKGRKGLYTLSNGIPELTVSGPMLIGFAYTQKGDALYLVDSSKLYRLQL